MSPDPRHVRLEDAAVAVVSNAGGVLGPDKLKARMMSHGYSARDIEIGTTRALAHGRLELSVGLQFKVVS